MSIEKPLGSVLIPSQAGLSGASITDRELPGGELTLPLIDWHGGSAYYEQYPIADAAGWADPSFFPIGNFLTKPDHASVYESVGINVAMAVEHDGSPVSHVTDHMFMLAHTEWTQEEVGSDPGVVSWFVDDEPELYYTLPVFKSHVDVRRGYDDGRFISTNFGNGIMDVGWYTNSEMKEAVKYVDACSVDKYAYSSNYVRGQLCGEGGFAFPPRWPGPDSNMDWARSCAAYGWQIDQLYYFAETPSEYQPFWIFVETKMPLLGDVGSEVILYSEIEAAAWNAICHGATGIMYFSHNGSYPGGNPVNDPNTGLPHCTQLYSIVECEQALRDFLTEFHGRIRALAPVINRQSYEFDFGATFIDTMLKSKDGYAYIFASVGFEGFENLGSKTFTLTGSGITGTTVTVVDEARSLNVSGGQFADTFATETTHHIYKVAI